MHGICLYYVCHPTDHGGAAPDATDQVCCIEVCLPSWPRCHPPAAMWEIQQCHPWPTEGQGSATKQGACALHWLHYTAEVSEGWGQRSLFLWVACGQMIKSKHLIVDQKLNFMFKSCLLFSFLSFGKPILCWMGLEGSISLLANASNRIAKAFTDIKLNTKQSTYWHWDISLPGTSQGGSFPSYVRYSTGVLPFISFFNSPPPIQTLTWWLAHH